MRIILLFVLCFPNLVSAQEFKFNIYPLDDASEWREEYQSLYNKHQYRLGFGQYDDSLLKFITDTNFIIIYGMGMMVKDTIGNTSFSILNAKTNQVLYKQTIQILDIPDLFFEVDKSELFYSNKAVVKLNDKKGMDVSESFYFAYSRFKLYDEKQSQINEGVFPEFEIALKGFDMSKAKYIILTGRVINRTNGLSSMVNKYENKL